MNWLVRSTIIFILALFPIQLYNDMTMPDSNDIICLSNILWREARGESIKGQHSVALVVLNRAKRRKLSVCAIMAQPKQFSWYEKHPDIVPLNIMHKQLALAYDTYTKYMKNEHKDHTKGATHFSGEYVNNYWTRKFKHTVTIGKHKFYRRDDEL